MLNKFRYAIDPALNKVGTAFASTGLSPNFWTTAALAMSSAAGVVYMLAGSHIGFHWYSISLTASILILISGFFDIVDGSVARVTNHHTKKGSYLDSVFDRVSEGVILIGLAIGNLANPISCQIALLLSLLVAYTRAKGESIGIEMKGVGIGERAERLLVLAIMGLVPFEGVLQIAVILVSIISAITFSQRMVQILKNL